MLRLNETVTTHILENDNTRLNKLKKGGACLQTNISANPLKLNYYIFALEIFAGIVKAAPADGRRVNRKPIRSYMT